MTPIKTVYEAFAAVMADVRAIEKGDRNQQQGFSFRGIDAVMQAVGPMLRKHGVFIIPTAEDMTTETYQTAKGTTMRSVTVTMRYTVYGPGGDYFQGRSFGEAADSGDKAVTKAQSVAYRTFLLQALTVPTGDADPDADTHERVAAPPPKPKTPADTARDALAALAKKHNINPGKLAQRFSTDYGLDIREADAETIIGFTGIVRDEITVDEAAG